jgi:hypothetical protein
MRCTTRAEHQGCHGGAAQALIPAPGPPIASDSQIKVKGKIEPTPQTEARTHSTALRLRLLRAMQRDAPRWRPGRMVAGPQPHRSAQAHRLLRLLPRLQPTGQTMTLGEVMLGTLEARPGTTTREIVTALPTLRRTGTGRTRRRSSGSWKSRVEVQR